MVDLNEEKLEKLISYCIGKKIPNNHPIKLAVETEGAKKKMVPLSSHFLRGLDMDGFIALVLPKKQSKDGLQSYCKNCHKKKISDSNSKIERFSKIILKKFKNENKNCIINISSKDIIDKFNEQKGKCFITNHNLTHICDLKQRTDNIWNYVLWPNK